MAPVVWQVIRIDAAGRGLGASGHHHATTAEATLCPYKPGGLPEVCAGFVREVRDPAYRVEREGASRSHPSHVI